MALIRCNFFSETLGMSTAMDVILPESASGQIGMDTRETGGEPPCLWLLHGLSDDHTIWQRRTSIERYAAPLGLAVVMPNVHRSFYTDMVHGYAYWTFLSEELPAVARRLFRLSGRREDNFVAGLSMGGYGAFKLAMRRPERFIAAASLSGALDIAHERPIPEYIGKRDRDRQLIFGDGEIAGTENDLLALADKLVQWGAEPPALYQWCGTEDFLYEDNLRFRDHASSIGLPLTYEEGPGDHEWGAWDRQIQRVLDWLPLPSGAPRREP